MNLKEIRFPIEIKSVRQARSYILQKTYTNDLNSVKLIFELLDCTPADLTGATASVLLYMRDGSFFQDTATIAGNTVTYMLTEAQGNHSGVAQAQVIVKKTGTEWASSKEKFEIISGLETVVAAEVMIQDWTMLTAEARAYLNTAEAAEAARNSAESTRIANEAARVNDFSSKADKTYTDTELAKKADKADTYTKAEVDGKDALKADLSEIETARGTETTLGARLDSTDVQLAETDQRIDNLVATSVPTGGIIAEEIIDARQGALSIGANISEVKSQLAETESKKVDKDGSGQVKWANIAQDAREQISGDKVAVVDDNSIITSNLTDNSVTPDKTSFLSFIENLYKGTNLTGVTISEAGFVKTIYANPSTTNWELAYIPVKNGGTYTVRVSMKTGKTNLFLAFTNGLTANTPIKRAYDMAVKSPEIIATVTNTNNYDYLLIRADDKNFILQNIEVYEDDSIPIGKLPIIKLNDVEVAKKTDIDNIRVKKHEGYLVTDHIDTYYLVTAEDIYALYDSLLADHEQYRTYRVTKNLLGEDDFGNNIYEYVFSRDTLDNGYDIRRKRIGITTTTHGTEKNTTIGLFEFMKELVINKDKNEVFNRIIGAVDIHIIPVLNPSGLALSTYHNANDVDLFANYDVNWERLLHLNKGSSPASEPETQIAQNWMQQNMFDVYFDYHRSDPTVDTNHFTWLVTDSEGPLREEYVKTIGLLSLIKAQQYEDFPAYETFGIVKQYPHQGKSYSYANSIGIEGALLEASGTWRYFDTDKLSLYVDWSKEVVGNMIMTVSRRWI